jgi:hypothetical protein
MLLFKMFFRFEMHRNNIFLQFNFNISKSKQSKKLKKRKIFKDRDGWQYKITHEYVVKNKTQAQQLKPKRP